MTNPDLIELAMQLSEGEPAQPPQLPTSEQHPPPLQTPPANPGLLHAPHKRGSKTADELAAMILADLRSVQGCPESGVNVVVYGFKPWNAWLSFGSAAGPVYNKAELQEFCDIFTERLKRLYDVLP